MSKDVTKNIKCELTRNAHNKPIFRFKWEWIVADNSLPRLQILYRMVQEDEILKHSLFTRDAITSYMFWGMDEHTHSALIARGESYGTMECELRPNGTIFYEGEIGIEQTGCVYFFYLINENGAIFNSFARKATNDMEVSYTEPKSLLGLGKKSMIRLEKVTSKRVLLQTTASGRTIYSLLPKGCTEYHIDPNVGDFKLIHLTNLINIQ